MIGIHDTISLLRLGVIRLEASTIGVLGSLLEERGLLYFGLSCVLLAYLHAST